MVIDSNENAIVESLSLRQTPLSPAILSWATKGAAARRIKEQPKDTLSYVCKVI